MVGRIHIAHWLLTFCPSLRDKLRVQYQCGTSQMWSGILVPQAPMREWRLSPVTDAYISMGYFTWSSKLFSPSNATGGTKPPSNPHSAQVLKKYSREGPLLVILGYQTVKLTISLISRPNWYKKEEKLWVFLGEFFCCFPYSEEKKFETEKSLEFFFGFDGRMAWLLCGILCAVTLPNQGLQVLAIGQLGMIPFDVIVYTLTNISVFEIRHSNKKPPFVSFHWNTPHSLRIVS